MIFRTGLLTFLIATAPALSSQETQPDSTPPQQTTKSVDDLIEQLGDESFKVRKAASKALADVGSKALDDLRAAAEDHDDPEVRMRAGRIIRRIEAAAAETETDVAQPPGEASRWGRLPRGSRAGVEGELRSLIEEIMQERLPDHRRWLERARQDFQPHELRFPIDGDSRSSSEKVSIQMGPDGVRVELESGGKDAEVYEAPDMETFKQEHPDIAEKYFGGSDGRFGFRTSPNLDFTIPRAVEIKPDELRRRFEIAQPEFTFPQGVFEVRPHDDFGVEQPAPAEGRRLGVYVDELHPSIGEFLGFDEGEGLTVTSVEDDSLASDLGIKTGDVLVSIDGKDIGTRADVGGALGSIGKGETVEVVVNRRGREVELDANKRVSAKQRKRKK